MKLSDLGSAFASALAGSAAIAAKCTDLFDSQVFTVYAGASGTQGIPEVDLPAFAVLPKAKDTSETAKERSFDIDIGCAFKQADPVEQFPGSVKVISYSGAEAMEAMLDLAVAAIRAVSPNFTLESARFEIETVAYFPLVSGMAKLNVTVPQVLGGFQIEL